MGEDDDFFAYEQATSAEEKDQADAFEEDDGLWVAYEQAKRAEEEEQLHQQGDDQAVTSEEEDGLWFAYEQAKRAKDSTETWKRRTRQTHPIVMRNIGTQGIF